MIRALVGVFFLLANVNATQAGELSPNIIGGTLLQPQQLPQTQRLTKTGCTGNLIGPRVIITAAHCVLWGREAFTLENGKSVEILNLTVNPAYETHDNLPHDFAFVADNAVGILATEITDRVPYTISKLVPNVGDQLLFAGVGRPNLGKRQYGYAEVWTLSENGLSLTGAKNKIAADGGDSGGAALIVGAKGRVELLGVNSTSSRAADQFGVPAYTTGVARVNNAVTIRFLENFAKEHGVGICGINLNCSEVQFTP